MKKKNPRKNKTKKNVHMLVGQVSLVRKKTLDLLT